MLLHLGTSVACSDGALGELADLVIHPGTRQVTHLVVAPHHHREQARLVPFELVAPADAKEIRLGATTAQAHALPEVQEYAYVRIDEGPLADDDEGTAGITEVISAPMDDYSGTFAASPISYGDHISVIYDRIPRGEVEARHASQVTGSDGERIGRLDGLVVDEQGTITQVVLERGHLWGRRRVMIPVDAVERFDMDGVTLSISKSKVAEILPTR